MITTELLNCSRARTDVKAPDYNGMEKSVICERGMIKQPNMSAAPISLWERNESKTAAALRPIERQLLVTDSVEDLIGYTPMLRLRRIEELYNLDVALWAKCEFFSAGGSVKDRIAKAMLELAETQRQIEAEQDLKADLENKSDQIAGEQILQGSGSTRKRLMGKGDYVIEATSGNTGIGLAMMCALREYKMVVVMPEKMSMEKENVLKALGAQVIRTPTSAGWDDEESHITTAYRLAAEINARAEGDEKLPRAFVLDQYKNDGNVSAHYYSTAQEILLQVPEIDAFFATAGTGGTITGVGRGLKDTREDCQVIAIDPVGSILHKKEYDLKRDILPYEVEGIGYDFKPATLDDVSGVIDHWITVNDQESFEMAKKLQRIEGLLCGGSSGTAVAGACKMILKNPNKYKNVVVLLPDGIRNYLSKFVSDDWMLIHHFIDVQDHPKFENPNNRAAINPDTSNPMPNKMDSRVISYDELKSMCSQSTASTFIPNFDHSMSIRECYRRMHQLDRKADALGQNFTSEFCIKNLDGDNKRFNEGSDGLTAEFGLVKNEEGYFMGFVARTDLEYSIANHKCSHTISTIIAKNSISVSICGSSKNGDPKYDDVQMEELRVRMLANAAQNIRFPLIVFNPFWSEELKKRFDVAAESLGDGGKSSEGNLLTGTKTLAASKYFADHFKKTLNRTRNDHTHTDHAKTDEPYCFVAPDVVASFFSLLDSE